MWREWDEPRIVEMLDYAAWLERNAATLDPPVELLDTTERSIEETAAAVCGWLTAPPRSVHHDPLPGTPPDSSQPARIIGGE